MQQVIEPEKKGKKNPLQLQEEKQKSLSVPWAHLFKYWRQSREQNLHKPESAEVWLMVELFILLLLLFSLLFGCFSFVLIGVILSRQNWQYKTVASEQS